MKTNILIPSISLEKCYGCGLCQNICQKKAIKMTFDLNGFLVPTINQSLCVNCGLCSTKCLANSENFKYLYREKPSFYYAFSKDNKIRSSSASGGIASTIYRKAIDLSWRVCGVISNKQHDITFLLTNKKEDIHHFASSKYVQSDSSNIYLEIKKALDNGNIVFFVGTPCQVNALKSFVGNPDNLFTSDVVCYGVGSSLFYKDYLSSFEKNNGSKVIEFKFRKKVKGTLNSYSIIRFDNGSEKKEMFYTNVFGKLFSKRLITRKSCDSCPFSSFNRAGDITLGDYVESNVKPKVSDLKKGCSLIRINSEKGKKIFDLIKDEIEFKNISEEDVRPFLVRQRSNSVIPNNSDAFFKDYRDYGYDYCVKKYYRVTKREKIRMRFYYDVERIKRIIKWKR